MSTTTNQNLNQQSSEANPLNLNHPMVLLTIVTITMMTLGMAILLVAIIMFMITFAIVTNGLTQVNPQIPPVPRTPPDLS